MPKSRNTSSSPPSSSSPPKFWKTPHFKKTTRSLIKKSAPFLLTALAGYVEHKWHEQEEEVQKLQDDRELEKERRKDREKEIERRASVESLRRQVDRLKRKIRRGGEGKGKQRARSSSESSESSSEAADEESVTKEIPRHHERRRTVAREREIGERAQPREAYFQGPAAYRDSLPPERYVSETTRITIKDQERRRPLWEQQRDDYFNRKRATSSSRIPQQPIPPTIPIPPIIFPEPIPITLEKEKEKQKISRRSFEQEQVQRRPAHRHHYRYSTGSRPAPGLSSEAMENAGKVAALTGFIEAVHVGDTEGNWIGEKGVRVATAAAGSAAVSYGKERIFGEGGKGGKYGRDERREGWLEGEIKRGSEVLGNVGAGLLVSRLVLGSSHPTVEEERRVRKRGRRWSYCY